MISFIQKFLTPRQTVAKKMLVVAIFGAFALGSVFFLGGHLSPVAVAHASGSSCSVATAMSDTVSDQTPTVGETITYTLTGAPALTASTTITVTDALGAGLTFVSANPSVGTYSSSTGTWNVGTLNGASAIMLAITAKVNAGTEGQTIINAPSIQYVQSNCTQSSATGSATIMVQGATITTPTSTPTSTPIADLSISKTADVTSTTEGGIVHYTITAKDNGPATSTGVVATDTLPTGLTFVSATTSEGSYASSTGTWTIGTLSASSTATLNIAALVKTGTAGSTITNTAIVGASTSTIDNNLANNSSSVAVTVVATTPVPCTLSAAQFEAAVASGTISWSAIATTTNVASFTIVNHTSCGAPISFASYEMFEVPPSPTWLSTQVLFSSTSTTLGASSTATLVVKLPYCQAQVDAFYGPVPYPLLDSNPYDYPNVPFHLEYVLTDIGNLCGGTPVTTGFSISKTVDNVSPSVGNTVHYTVAVGNIGSATSTGVVATDTLPTGLTFVSATTSEGSYASSTGTWTIGTLSASSTATLNIAALVNGSDTVGQQITNTASVASDTASVTLTVASSTPVPCTLSAAQFEAAVASGTISWAPITTATSTASFTIVNHTACTAPISLASYKMFVAQNQPHWLSTQVLFSSTSITLGASSTATLVVELPSCMAQVDAYYGSVPYPLLDSNPYRYPNVPFVLASAFANSGNFCGAISTPTVGFSISKTVDNTSPSTGNTVHYTVTVGKIGSATSTGVVATDTLPSGLTFENATTSVGTYASSTGTWTIGTLSASSTATLQVAAMVNASDTVGQQITNTATVASDTASVTLTVASGGGTAPTSTPVANLSIKKTVDNTSPTPGATINYTLTVNAQGPATSTGVVATDTLPTGLTFVSATTSEGSYASSTGTWTIGTLSASSTATLNIAALVNASDTVGQQITNTGIVGESTSTTNPNGNSSSSVTVTVTSPVCTVDCGGGSGNDAELSIAKTANVTSTLPGGVIDYTITATAGGPQPSTGVVATDTLPSGLTFENATTSVGTYASSTGTWTIGTLAPNATATLEIAALVNASGTANTTITNQATIGESPTLVNPSGNTIAQASVIVGTPASTANEADLAINKTVDNASPVTGTDVNFTVVVTNNGPDTATQVVAEDQVPIGLATVSATTTASTTFNMGTGEWNIGTLAPNATATLTIEAEVSAPAGTAITNTATVTSTLASLIDPNLANNSSSVTLNVQAAPCTSDCGGGGGGGGGGGNTPTAQLNIVKTVDNSTPTTGATINYTLTVSDSGPSASFGVVASDTLPAGITFDSASSSEGSYNGSTGIWTIGDIANGQSATLVITATVTAADGTTITNTGTVSESPAAQSPLSGPMTSSVTITVGGSGGGGGGGNGGGGGTVGVGGGGGQVLGASTSTGQVLGASCGLYLTSYIHPIRKNLNDPTEVKKLQVFLNQNLGLSLPVTGDYDAATIAAVNQFQVKYHIEVLAPWLPLGLPTQFTPTSYVYQTTQRWINLIMCPPLNLPIPALKVDNGE